MKYLENIKDLNEYYKVNSKHPLIDIQKYSNIDSSKSLKKGAVVLGFYKISFITNFKEHSEKIKSNSNNSKKVLNFVEPGQKYFHTSAKELKGYQILIHPDIFKKHLTEKSIIKYNFFSYYLTDFLHLSEDEQNTVSFLMEQAWKEFNNKNDDFSIPIILSYISALLNLSERFYSQQFRTRKTMCNRVSNKFFKLLRTYYVKSKNIENKQPSLFYFAEKLNVTPNYLSSTIKHHTGQSALNIIHGYIIEEAKKLLTTSNQSVSQISEMLGFEYPNYFSRLFKKNTSFSPTEFRKSVKSI